MSGHGILKYFRPVVNKKDPPEDKKLPDPSGPLSKVIPSSSIASCNAEVAKVLKQAKPASVAKKCYTKLTPVQRYEIGKKGAEMGVTAAIRYYKKKFPDLSLTEPTVRRLKNLYLEELAKKPLDADCSEFNELPYKKYGRPLNVGEEVDCQVQAYIKDLRESGAPVNTAIVIATGKGIAMDKASDTSIASPDMDIYLTKDWAKYLMKRMGMVKRRASTKAKTTVINFDELKETFLQDIKHSMLMDEIPPELVINFDQTGIHYVPVSSWSMEMEGAKRVEVVGKDDKRQITAIFGISMSGDFLPIQLVYQGKTTKCLPSFDFPPSWDITFSDNHWSNEQTMLSYFEKVIFPYLQKKKAELQLEPDHPALLLFDNFKAQCTEDILKLLDTKNIDVVIIPANCTDRLQPLDLSINKAAKEFLRGKFQEWYAMQIFNQRQGKIEKKPVDLRLSKVKPMGARWMVSLHDHLKAKPDMIRDAFKAAGIVNCHL